MFFILYHSLAGLKIWESVCGAQSVPVCIGWTGVRRMNACEVTASVTALANTLACQMTTDELNLLGVILTQLGDTILTIAAHREICGGK